MTARSAAAAYVTTQIPKNAAQMQILIISVTLNKNAVKGFVATLIASSAVMEIAAKTGSAVSMVTVSTLYAIIVTQLVKASGNVTIRMVLLTAHHV